MADTALRVQTASRRQNIATPRFYLLKSISESFYTIVCRYEEYVAGKFVMPIVLMCLILVYTGLSLFVWRRYRSYAKDAYPLRTELAVLGGALLLQGIVLLMPVLQDHVVIMGFGYAVSLIVWLMLMIYGVGSFSIA